MTEAQRIEAAEAASLAARGHASLCAAVPRPAMPGRGGARYHEKLGRVLATMGGIYTVDDLLTRIYDGRMQSHVVNNSWVITEIDCYPRARTLHVVAMVGDLEDRDEIEHRLVAFADEANAGLISAHGRMGWLPHARELGWRVKARSYLFQKEM